MSDILHRVWEHLLARTEGPMHLRFYIQPVVSLIFAIRAGMRDAKLNVVPQLQRFFFSRSERKTIMREVWKDVGRIFIIGTVFDIIYQLIVIFVKKTAAMFYPLESLIVAFLLAIIPYIIFRGPANRLVRLFMKKKQTGDVTEISEK